MLIARHVQIDRRVIEPRIAGRDAEHLAIAQAVGRSDADGKHRRPTGFASDPTLTRPHPPDPPHRPRVAAIGEHDDAGDALAAIPLANGGQRAGEIGAPRVGGQAVDLRGRDAFADGEDLGLEARRERGASSFFSSASARAMRVCPSASASRMLRETSTRIGTMASRVAGRRQDRNRAEEAEDEDRQREHAQRHQHAALDARQRRERAPISPYATAAIAAASRTASHHGKRIGKVHAVAS